MGQYVAVPMTTNKFGNKENACVVAIMRAVHSGEVESSAIEVEGFAPDSVRRFVNEGVAFGAIRKCVDRVGRQTGSIQLTTLGEKWWGSSEEPDSEIVLPDWWEVPDEYLSDSEALQKAEIERRLGRKRWEEERAARAATPPDWVLELLEEEREGTIDELGNAQLEDFRASGQLPARGEG